MMRPLPEATPDPTPTETPRPIITPDPDIHQTWTSFTDWDPVIQLYHYNESYAIVTRTIYNTTIRAVDWGIPEISGTRITMNAELIQNMDVSPRLKNNYTHEYHLGTLTENQTYTFVFKADSHIVKEVTFTVRPSPVASPFPGGTTDYDPATSISIETIGEITYAKVDYLLFEKEDILHIITPNYPLGGPVTAAGNVYSVQPEILRYVGSEDLVSEQLIRHYSVKYTLGALGPDTYTFKSFNTTKEFTIEWGPTPSPTPGSIDNPGSIWFKPMDSEVRKNTSFTTDLRANSGTQMIAAYGIKITFLPDIIRPDTTIGPDGVEAGADGFIAAANSANPGKLVISGFDIAGTGPGPDLQLVIIHWNALEEGTSYLYLDVDKFIDPDTDDIGDFQGISGSVTVLPAVLLGDVNNDSSIDIVDALVVAQYFVGLAPTPFNPAAADVNCDSTIDIVDALVITRYFVGLIDELC